MDSYDYYPVLWNWCKQLFSYQTILEKDAMAYMQHVDIRKVVEYFQFFWIQENPKPCETVTVPFVSALLSSHGTVRREAIIVYMTKVSIEHQQVLS